MHFTIDRDYPKPSGPIPVIIEKSAKKLATEFYKMASQDDDFCARYKDMATFERLEWHVFIPVARQALERSLSDNTLPRGLKRTIRAALKGPRNEH